jgi:hypothetical protein
MAKAFCIEEGRTFARAVALDRRAVFFKKSLRVSMNDFYQVVVSGWASRECSGCLRAALVEVKSRKGRKYRSAV